MTLPLPIEYREHITEIEDRKAGGLTMTETIMLQAVNDAKGLEHRIMELEGEANRRNILQDNAADVMVIVGDKETDKKAVIKMMDLFAETIKTYNEKHPLKGDPWLSRLKDEREKLAIRYDKLDEALLDDMVNGYTVFDADDRRLLENQSTAMATYGRIMDARIARADAKGQ